MTSSRTLRALGAPTVLRPAESSIGIESVGGGIVRSAVATSSIHSAPRLGAEPCGGGAVDDVVIDGHGEIEDVADQNPGLDHARPRAQSADDDGQRGESGLSPCEH